MEDHRPESIVYVTLDALLDTRLGTLSKINQDAADIASKDSRYYNREIDDFTDICGIDKDTFRSMYQKRDVSVLQASMLTEIPFILNELVLRLEQESIDTPFLSRVKVEVNTFPYRLEKEEKEAIELAVMHRCGFETVVTCIYLDVKQLSPSYIRSRYSGMIIYDFHDWMQHHLKEFETVKMPQISLLAPAIYYDEVPSPDEFREDGIAEGITGFMLAEAGTVELFALSLLPAKAFSMLILPGTVLNNTVKKEEVGPKPKAPAPYEEL